MNTKFATKPYGHRLIQFLDRFMLILLITFLLLELITRLVWWNQQTITLFNKQITLLPRPLVSEKQIAILEEWSNNPEHYVQMDPILGWSIRPNMSEELQGVTYTSNSIGIRSLREYDLTPPPGVIRLAAFGPSFMHGDEAYDNQTWEAQLEQMRPDVEVMNWGVGGHGTDQAFLRYKTQGAAYQPDIVIIGFEEENVSRNANHFRPFYRPGTGFPLTKPRFITDTNGLVLLKNPFDNFDDFYNTLLNKPERFLDVVCPDDIFCNEVIYQSHPLDIFTSFRFFRTLIFEMQADTIDDVSSESYQQSYQAAITVQVIQAFLKESVDNGSVPIVLVFPEQSTISDYEHGVAPPYQTGIVALRDMGVHVIDLAGALAEVKQTQNLEYQDFYASEGGHFNKLGNQVVAQTILWHLCGQGLLTQCN